ncbi:hypothetical protein MMC25_002334 [Agyrium rufum]|nr:hypothetical protein [Agyrium rufum]
MSRLEKSSAQKRKRPTAVLERQSNLSAEYIIDSDQEAGPTISESLSSSTSTKNHNAIHKPPQKKLAIRAAASPMPNPTPRKSQTSNAAGKVQTPKSGETVIPSKNQADSSDSSDTGSDSDSDTPVKPTNGKALKVHAKSSRVNGEKSRKAPSSTTSSGSEEESEVEHAGKGSSKAATNRPTQQVEKRVGSAAGIRAKPKPQVSIGVSSDSDDSDNSTNSVAPPSAQPHTTASSKPPEDVTSSQNPYKPPEGFKRASIRLPANVEAPLLTDSASLEGKQLFYITAPSSLPVSVLKGQILQSMTGSTSLIEHRGQRYGFTEDADFDPSKHRLLIPSEQGDEYKPVSKSLSRSFHLRLKPNTARLSSSAQQQSTPMKLAPKVDPKTYSKPVRQQPKGLKVRYHALGDSNGGSTSMGGDLSSELSDEELSGFRMPLDTPRAVSPKKRRRESHGKGEIQVPDSQDIADTPGGKKRRKDKGNTSTAHEPIQKSLDTPGKPNGELQKSQHPEIDAMDLDDFDTAQPAPVLSNGHPIPETTRESSDERARRKKEKRRKRREAEVNDNPSTTNNSMIDASQGTLVSKQKAQVLDSASSEQSRRKEKSGKQKSDSEVIAELGGQNDGIVPVKEKRKKKKENKEHL